MKRSVQKTLAIGSLLIGEAAAVAMLVIVGNAPFMRLDIRNADPIDSLMAIVRIVALLGVLWLATTTLTYLLAGARRARVPRWFTIPVVRRIVDATLAVAIATGGIAQPALAASPPVIVTVDPSGMVLPPGAAVGHPRTSTPVVESPATRAETAVIVMKGDNLWSISRRHLESLGIGADGLPPYWAKVVDTNRDHLRSGNPDLIYPGETVLLPRT